MSRTEKLKDGQKLFFAEPPDLAKAKESFQSVTELAPNWVEGYHWLASTLERLGENASAVKAYREAIRCDNNDSRPKIGLGRLLTFLGNYREAVAELQRGLTLKPHYGEADARLFLAEAFEKEREILKAIEQWKIVRDMEPMYPSYDHPQQEAERKLREHANNVR